MAYQPVPSAMYPSLNPPTNPTAPFRSAPVAQPVEFENLPVAQVVLASVQERKSNVVITPDPPTRVELRNIIVNRRVQFSCCRYFGEACSFMKHNACALIGTAFLYGLTIVAALFGIAVAFCNVIDFDDVDWDDMDWDYYYSWDTDSWEEYYSWDSDEFWDSDGLMMLLSVLFFVMVLFIFVFIPLCVGFSMAVVKALREQAYFRTCDVFQVFECKRYCRILSFLCAMSIISSIAYQFFIIPGLYFTIVTVFALPLRFEHDHVGICQAINYSSRIVHRYCCSMMGFLVLVMIVYYLGFLCFGVGMLFTCPFCGVAMLFCYNHLIGINKVPLSVPADSHFLQPGFVGGHPLEYTQ